MARKPKLTPIQQLNLLVKERTILNEELFAREERVRKLTEKRDYEILTKRLFYFEKIYLDIPIINVNYGIRDFLYPKIEFNNNQYDLCAFIIQLSTTDIVLNYSNSYMNSIKLSLKLNTIKLNYLKTIIDRYSIFYTDLKMFTLKVEVKYNRLIEAFNIDTFKEKIKILSDKIKIINDEKIISEGMIFLSSTQYWYNKTEGIDDDYNRYPSAQYKYVDEIRILSATKNMVTFYIKNTNITQLSKRKVHLRKFMERRNFKLTKQSKRKLKLLEIIYF